MQNGSEAWPWMVYQWAEHKESSLRVAFTEELFRIAISVILMGRDDATRPEQGWPWPWEDSATTDYAYCLNDGKVEVYCFGRPVTFDSDGRSVDEAEQAPKRTDWRNMRDVQKVTLGERSGLIVFPGLKLP